VQTVKSIAELEVARDIERQLVALLARLPKLSELPIAPLRGVDDLIRLELALKNFAQIHRSKRSKLMISAVRILLEGARTRLREVVAVKAEGWRAHQVPFRDTQPAAFSPRSN
jgi:hypothetical protein